MVAGYHWCAGEEPHDTAPRTVRRRRSLWVLRSASLAPFGIGTVGCTGSSYASLAHRVNCPPFEPLALAGQVLDVRADRLYLKAAAAQFRGEVIERFAAGDECAAEALASEAPNHAGADSWSGPDEQE